MDPFVNIMNTNHSVNNKGIVMNNKTKKILTPGLWNGYEFVFIKVGDKNKAMYIHRLVA